MLRKINEHDSNFDCDAYLEKKVFVICLSLRICLCFLFSERSLLFTINNALQMKGISFWYKCLPLSNQEKKKIYKIEIACKNLLFFKLYSRFLCRHIKVHVHGRHFLFAYFIVS